MKRLARGFVLWAVFAALTLAAEVPLYLRTPGAEVPRRAEKSLKTLPANGVSLTLIAPSSGAIVPTLNEQQKAYLALPRAERIEFFASPEKRKELRTAGYHPLPVKLQWHCVNAAPHTHQLWISESPDFKDSAVFTVKGHELSIDNLKIAQEYHWRIVDENNGIRVGSAPAAFTTEAVAPRLLRVDGVPNVRDVGGRIGLGGRRVKQGLICRTAGLNDNAHAVPYTAEELEALFSQRPELRALYEAYQRQIGTWRELQENKTPVEYLTIPLSREWHVYIPETHTSKARIRELSAATKTIPDELRGAKFRIMTADENGAIVFPPRENHCAFFLQEFESPEEGVAQLGIGTDWFTLVAVNGEIVFDTLVKGNEKHPVDSGNYIIEIPVKKGKNLIFAGVRSGSAAWAWCCCQPSPRHSRDHALRDMIKLHRTAADALLPAKLAPGKNRLDDAMKRYLIDDLGWKSDIDLRSDGECFGMTGSPAGDPVKWFHYSSWAYGGMQSEGGREAFTKVFRVFLDPQNYPIDFHCIAGQDRTGAVAFILNALLGVEEEELYRDWESTGFWNPNPTFNHRNLFNKLVEGFSKYPGGTIQERVENYVLSLGFTPEEIRQFREFMLEK